MLDLLLVFICSFLSFFLFVNSRAGMSYSNLFVAHLRGRSPEAPSGAFATLVKPNLCAAPLPAPATVIFRSGSVLKYRGAERSLFGAWRGDRPLEGTRGQVGGEVERARDDEAPSGASEPTRTPRDERGFHNGHNSGGRRWTGF